MSQRHSLAAAN